MGKRSVRININPVGQRFASPTERIIEFSAGTDGAGGLISLRYGDNGRISIDIYRHEKTDVRVSAADELSSSPAVGAGVQAATSGNVDPGDWHEDMAAEFFYEHAPTSYRPDAETEEEGRRRGAAEYARAEATARRDGWSFSWDRDPELTSQEFSDETPYYSTWICRAFDADDEQVVSSGGIDFGRDGSPDSDEGKDYRRVIEAQLAYEYTSNGITPKRREAFEALTSGRHDNFVLIHTTYDGVPTAAIAATVTDPYVGDAVEIHPIAVFVTPAMFERLTPPDEGMHPAND